MTSCQMWLGGKLDKSKPEYFRLSDILQHKFDILGQRVTMSDDDYHHNNNNKKDRLSFDEIALSRGWANFLVWGLHHWVMNYQRVTSLKSKEFSLDSSARVYFFSGSSGLHGTVYPPLLLAKMSTHWMNIFYVQFRASEGWKGSTPLFCQELCL